MTDRPIHTFHPDHETFQTRLVSHRGKRPDPAGPPANPNSLPVSQQPMENGWAMTYCPAQIGVCKSIGQR